MALGWIRVKGSDPRALAVVDGIGEFERYGAHYSRRTRYAKTFTGVGRQVVLLHESLRAVWAVVYAQVPTPRGGKRLDSHRFLWRNNLFRNLGAGRSSDLIKSAYVATCDEWVKTYGSLPSERLRTEVKISAVRSSNPGFCYQKAGWEKGEVVRGKLYLYAPEVPS